MKAVFKRIRFSRRFVLLGGGLLLIGGASGMAAVMVGKDKIFGSSYSAINGLDCKTVQTFNIKKNGSLWVRRFIRTDGGDGVERAKTALRVAKAIYDKQKPDLVQVSVLDAAGPQMRSEMRGRAIAAQAIYIADPAKLPEVENAQAYSAYYYDGSVSSDGQYYGLRIDLPAEDAKAMTLSLSDESDCINPVAAGTEGHGADKGGHDAAPADHGASPSGDGHSGGDGHAPSAAPAEGGAETAKDGHGAPAGGDAGHGGEAAHGPEPLMTSTPAGEGESLFSLAYVKSLFFGKGPSTAVAAEPGAAAVADEPAPANDAANKPDEPAKTEH